MIPREQTMADWISEADQWIESREKTRKEYLSELDRAIQKYGKKKTVSANNEVLRVLLEGIQENYILPVRPLVDKQWTSTVREYYRSSKNHKYLAAYSNYRTLASALSSDQSLRGIIRLIESDPECRGLAINPGQKAKYLIKRELLASLLNAGFAAAKDERRSQRVVSRLENLLQEQVLIQTPVNLSTFNRLEEKIRSLKDSEGDSFAIHVCAKKGLPFSIILTGGPQIHILIKSFSLPIFRGQRTDVFHEYKDLDVDKLVETVKSMVLYDEPTPLAKHFGMDFCGSLEEFEDEQEFVRFWNEAHNDCCYG